MPKPTAIRDIPDMLLAFLKKAEGVATRAYRDSAGVWTIGVGHTGPEVHAAARWTDDQIDEALRRDIDTAARRLAGVVRPAALHALSDNQYAALVSFVFNLGANPAWTIWKVVNAGQLGAVPAQMLRFTKARDDRTGRLVEVRGLVNRRMAEVALWKTADVTEAVAIVGAAAAPPPVSGFMRMTETPPEPMPGKPLAVSKSFVASAAAAVATGASAALALVEPAAQGAQAAADAIAPFAAGSAMVAEWRGALLLVAAALAMATPMLIALKAYRSRTR